MHTFAFQYHKLDCVYVPFPVQPEHLAQAVAGAVALGVRGFNVTIPHKEAIMTHLHTVSPEAHFIGAVNTVLVQEGQTMGYNTDGEGFLQPLQAVAPSLTQLTGCVLGAGGAARALTTALLQAGCPALTIANRTPARAERLVAALQERFPQAAVQAMPFAKVAENARASTLLVNATSVGLHQTDEPLLPDTCFHSDQVVYDIVYRPRDTPLLQAARRRGATVISGLDMLIGQGAAAFTIWTGLPFPIAAVRRMLQSLLSTTP
jgi:shikimate dehydrogenase